MIQLNRETNETREKEGHSLDRVEGAPVSEGRLSRKELLAALSVGLTLAGVAIVAGLWLGPRVVRTPARISDAPEVGRSVTPFTLTDRTGRTVTHEELRGKYLVVSFVFTSCSLSCRVVNDRMAEVQRLLADASDVRLVSFTVDPRTDTPAVLATFAAGYGADTNRWLFLTGPKPELYRVIEASFLPRSSELETLIPGGFANTDRLLVVGPAGRVRAVFNGLSTETPRDIVDTILRLRSAEGDS